MENQLKFCQANTKQISREKAIIPFTLTTFAVDRDGDVIFPSGGVLTNFRKNPISLFMHNAFDVPPARLLPDSIKSTTQEMTGDVEFDVANDQFAEFLFEKFANGFLSAGSIRFIPIEFDREQVLEGQTGLAIKVWELIEFSLVTIPSNPEALRKEYDQAREGSYLDYQKPYYSTIEKFTKYKNSNIDIEKQIFPFCEGEGCKDVLNVKAKEDEEIIINNDGIFKKYPVNLDERWEKEVAEQEKSSIQDIMDGLKRIENGIEDLKESKDSEVLEISKENGSIDNEVLQVYLKNRFNK